MNKLYALLFLLFVTNVYAQSPQGFFLNDYAHKTPVIPPSTNAVKPVKAATVTVSVDTTDVVANVSKYLFGNNANVYMTQMVDQPALIDYITKLSPNVIRFPGGNLSSIYFFNASKKEDLPADVPEKIPDANGTLGDSYPYWYGGNTDSWTMSVDNYYNMLDMTGSTGIITINYAYARYSKATNPVAAAAHLAAEWVRYDNGRTKFWEIGNESNGTWQAGYRINTADNKDGQPQLITGALYGQHYKVFVDSMQTAAAEIGATIYIGAQLLQEAPASWATDTDKNWNNGVFQQAGNVPDFHIIHSYYTPYATNSNANDILKTATDVTHEMFDYVKTSVTNAGLIQKPLALTEWNIFAEGSKQQVSYINGMHGAIVLGELIKNGYGMASRWDLANSWGDGNDHGMFSQGGEPGVPMWNPRPQFHYMYYFQKTFGDQMVKSTVTGSANVLAYASRYFSDHVGMVIVNKGSTAETISIDISGYNAGDKYYVYSLTGGTDNGEFSLKVNVNGIGPSFTNGGPNNVATLPARAYPTGGVIKVASPAKSVQYILLASGSNAFVKATSITITGGANTITESEGTLQLSASVLPANAGEQDVVWSIVEGGTAATIAANGVVTAVANGTVKVRATANDESGVFGEFTITITGQLVTGEEDEIAAAIKVYPNPTKGTIYIENAKNINQVSLRDALGQRLLELNNSNGDDTLVMDLKHSTGGIFFLFCRARSGQVITKKIVVSK